MSNESVFGKLKVDSSDCYIFDGGLTLRDYFAGLAMQGALASPLFNTSNKTAAKLAYEMADAMLEERSKCPS